MFGINQVSTRGLMDRSQRPDSIAAESGCRNGFLLSADGRTTQTLVGNRQLLSRLAEIRHLRVRCGQVDDYTTDPEYFIAANALENRRCAAVLIMRGPELEACVLFYEHTRFGVGLGLFRGGDYIGEGLVVSPAALRLQAVQLASEALLRTRRIHGVSLTIKASADACIELMGPASHYRRFLGSEVQHKLQLQCTYDAMLASLGHRTRRSLAGKRQQLEKSMDVRFLPSLEPARSLEATLALESRSIYPRASRFFHARERLLRAHSEFFSMGLRLPGGTWLSVLSGWRSNRVTYVDMQINDMRYRKESISAVMRAFFLEHEIGVGQQSINFVGGSSLLLRRYCAPVEPCTDIFIWKPCLRAKFFELIATRVQSGSVYERVNPAGLVPASAE